MTTFAPAMTEPTYRRFCLLTAAAILCRGRHAVTRMTSLIGELADGDVSDYHRVLSRAPWKYNLMTKALAAAVLKLVPFGGAVTVVIDDTTAQHKGKRVFGKDCHRDAVASSHNQARYVYGHRWIVLAVVAVLNFGRLARWRPLATLSEPLLWVLHLGYLWVPTGLALASLAALLGWPNDIAALHALAMGVMGTMILAVMGRVAKGHTGRPLTAGPLLTVAYVILGLSVLARIAAVIFPDYSDVLLNTAALGWCLAFALFLVSCGPYLVARRPPAKSF